MIQNNALFVYRRRQELDNVAYTNENFISCAQVTSAYWQKQKNPETDEINTVLSIYLTNGFNVVLPEKTGRQFLDHWENFLRLMVNAGLTRTSEPARDSQVKPKTMRRSNEVIEDDEVGTMENPASWEPASA